MGSGTHALTAQVSKQKTIIKKKKKCIKGKILKYKTDIALITKGPNFKYW